MSNDAIVQFEIDHERWGSASKDAPGSYVDNHRLLMDLCAMWVRDTLRHGGTFVLVAGSERVTVVQRSGAEPLEPVAARKG